MNKVFVFDVTYKGEYKGQMGFKFCPLFPIEYDELNKSVVERFPTLEGKDFKVHPITTVEEKDYRKYKKYQKS